MKRTRQFHWTHPTYYVSIIHLVQNRFILKRKPLKCIPIFDSPRHRIIQQYPCSKSLGSCIHDLVVHVPVGSSDNKIHGANMGLTWVLPAPDGPNVGPMNLAIWVTMLYYVFILCVQKRREWHIFVTSLKEKHCQDTPVWRLSRTEMLLPNHHINSLTPACHNTDAQEQWLWQQIYALRDWAVVSFDILISTDFHPPRYPSAVICCNTWFIY